MAEAQKPTAQQLIDAANAASDLAKFGPFELSADLVINPGTRAEAGGHLQIYGDKDRRRAELQLGTYQEVRLHLGDKLYISRSETSPVFGFGRIMNLDHIWLVKIRHGAKLSNVKNKDENGVPVSCFHEKLEFDDEEYCFLASGALVHQQNKWGTEISTLEYHALEGTQFPSSLIFREKRFSRTIALRNIRLTKLQPDENTFVVPPAALLLGQCEDPQGGQMLKRVEPRFPQSQIHGGPGVMFIYGVIEKDGSFTNVHVYSPTGLLFEDAVKRVIPEWKFAPTTCGGEPVAVEREISIEIERH